MGPLVRSLRTLRCDLPRRHEVALELSDGGEHPRMSRDIVSPPGRMSMPCVVAVNRMPDASRSRMFASTSSAERPKRSSFQTITASSFPRRAASIRR